MAQPAVSAITKAINSSAIGAKHPAGLPPTPPNSISPNLPANALRGHLSPPPIHIDQQDLDLQDAVDHAAAQDQPQLATVPLSKGALSGLEDTQAITPTMLASDHLPGIILGHGPIAIRHVMGCLTQSVPGFSRIPPAKARRLVVAALESRSGGGPKGDIEFEKVGWGRWDAHVRGQKYHSAFDKLSPPMSEPSSYAVSNPGSFLPIKTRTPNDFHGRSWTGSSMPFDEALEDMSMSSDHEADNMSLDSVSDSGDDDTEPEDWAGMGADALRKASIPTAASGGTRRNYNLLCIPGGSYRDDRRPSIVSHRTLGSSMPQSQSAFPTGGAMDVDQTPEEREAVQALMRLGSM